MLTRLRWFTFGVLTAVVAAVSVRNPALRDRLARAIKAAGRAAVTSAADQLRQG